MRELEARQAPDQPGPFEQLGGLDSQARALIARLDSIGRSGGSAGSAALRRPLAGIVAPFGIAPGEVIGTTAGADLHTVMVFAQITGSKAIKLMVGDPVQLSLLPGIVSVTALLTLLVPPSLYSGIDRVNGPSSRKNSSAQPVD